MTDHETIEAEVVRENDGAGRKQRQRHHRRRRRYSSPTLYLLPLSERPFFPAQALPLLLNEDPWLTTVEAAANLEQRVIGLILVKPDSAEKPMARRISTRSARSPACINWPATMAVCNSSPRD